jgi:cytochrome c-type biogenesis protein CcmH
MNKKIHCAATMLFATWLCLTPLGNAFAVLPEEVLPDPVLEARARVISQDLRCLVCQNQSIDDSNAPLAKDLRVIVRERLTAGDTDKQVFGYVVARYGNYVLLKPPLQSDTFLLWASPFIMLFISLGVAFAYLRKRPALEDDSDVSNSDMKDE